MNKGNEKNNPASPKISIVVPVYKEERGIRPFLLMRLNLLWLNIPGI